MSKEKFSIENISFGKSLQEFRKSQGMTLAALSNALNTSPGYLSEVERGMKKPGSDLLFALKREYDLDINALLEGTVLFLTPNSVKEPPTSYPIKSEDEELSTLAAQIISEVENSSISTDSKVEITASILRMINQKIENKSKPDE
ncbi:MAG: helix-turn-helix transcriptional regulator [Cyanothece sp. SIO1E1]|nr:helix-turn-helix transcriptional regulator [Cyanothece sp. SIO1E1]